MMDRLFGSHVNNLSNSLGRTTLRHSLVTQNLANVNTPGYKRRDVDFGVELSRAESRFRIRNTDDSPEIRTYEGSLRRDGNSVDLEAEVVALAETEFRYRLLTDMTNRYFNGLKNVIREGR